MTKTTAPVFSDIQKVNPSSIIELFKLELKEGLNYATGNPSNVTTVHRFHSGSNLDAYGNIVWNGETYLRFPVEASGFAFQRGQLPRPTITVSNMGTPSMSAVLLAANGFTAGNDLTGAKVTRIRTMAKFVDAANFSGATTSGNVSITKTASYKFTCPEWSKVIDVPNLATITATFVQKFEP